MINTYAELKALALGLNLPEVTDTSAGAIPASRPMARWGAGGHPASMPPSANAAGTTARC